MTISEQILNFLNTISDESLSTVIGYAYPKESSEERFEHLDTYQQNRKYLKPRREIVQADPQLEQENTKVMIVKYLVDQGTNARDYLRIAMNLKLINEFVKIVLESSHFSFHSDGRIEYGGLNPQYYDLLPPEPSMVIAHQHIILNPHFATEPAT